MATLAVAHEVPVPHTHPHETNELTPFILFVVALLAIGWGVTHLYKYFKRIGQV